MVGDYTILNRDEGEKDTFFTIIQTKCRTRTKGKKGSEMRKKGEQRGMYTNS